MLEERVRNRSAKPKRAPSSTHGFAVERGYRPMGATAMASGRIIASSRKYDLLTAIALGGLAGVAIRETLALRLIALITARYDWTRDKVAVGQEELQRLWSVSRRTVIRDIAELRRLGILVLIEAGRRGRVATYRLGHTALDDLLVPTATQAGNALSDRLLTAPRPKEAEIADITKFMDDRQNLEPAWLAVRETVTHEIGEAAAARWLSPLLSDGLAQDALRLTAPSQFHADYVARTHGARLDRAAATLLRARRVDVRAPKGHSLS